MKFSASKSPLLTICMYPFRPELVAPEAPSDPAAQIGTVAWARLAAHIEGAADPGNGEELSLDDAAKVDAIVAIGKVWLERERASMRAPKCEVKYAWSPSKDAARELPKTSSLRDYSNAKADEVCGSTDLEYLADDEVLTVEDCKTGFTPLVNYVPQIRTLGLFVARSRGVRKIRVILTKLYEDRPPESIVSILDGFALDAIAEDLRNRLAAAPASEPIPGGHCTEMFCPARLVCPAVPALIAELVPADALVKGPKFSHTFISHDHDARMLDFCRLLKKAADDMKKQIELRTPQAGVQLGDGRWLGEGTHYETKFSEAQLKAKIRELGEAAKLDDEAIDLAIDSCSYRYEKSGGYKVTKGPPKRVNALPSKKTEAA